MPTRRGVDLLCNVFGFRTFPGAYAAFAFHFSRLRHRRGAASGPESKPAEERTREKEISRSERERVPWSIDSVSPRDRPRSRMRVSVQVRADATPHAPSSCFARVYYNMLCVPRIYAGRPRRSTGPRARIYAGNERVIFQPCSSHEWAPRRVDFTDTSAAPSRSDALLLPRH